MKGRILLIEDNPQNRYLATFLLEKDGYEVVQAADGAAGIRLAGESFARLVLLDIQLPVMDGYAVARELRKIPALKAVPIVAVTSYAMPGDREKAVAAGCDGYLEKPIDPETFVARVGLYIEEGREGATAMKAQRILIVDDNEENLYLLRTLLEGHGYEVESARQGQEALEKARQALPDLVVSDILMPVMDGFTLCREWKKEPRLKETPFVFYTATYTDERDRKFGLSLGAEEFLVKPVEPEEVLQAIRKALECGGAGFKPEAEAGGKVEEVYLKQYNEALVRKLEAKMQQLEALNFQLEKDIAARQEAEAQRAAMQEQLAQAAKLESIGRLAGGVAHDFNNLLSVIMSHAELALLSARKRSPLAAHLGQILAVCARAAALTRQLLAFGRKGVIQPAPLDLNRAAKGVEKMLRRLIGEDVDLRLVLAQDLRLIRADPGQIDQILVNLAVNARDAMPRGGRLTIETANAEDRLEARPGPCVALTVADTGVGMDGPTRARIFEPFFTTKEQGKGTGLGLAMVYGIVKQGNGAIEVSSEPGKGTSFKLFFPPDLSAKAPPRRRPAAGKRPRGKETILLVEDEETVRDVTKTILGLAGYKVLVCAGGKEALAAQARYKGGIDLLLTDVVMPGLGGKTLVKEIREARPDMGVLYMSGYPDDVLSGQGELEAGTSFIGKPFTTAELTRKVREVLDDKRGATPRKAG